MKDTQFTMDRFLTLEERVEALEKRSQNVGDMLTYKMGQQHMKECCIALMRSKGYWAAKDALEAM